MAITIGRLGYLGLGIETTPGQAVGPAVYLPYTENSMRGHHKPIDDIASKASRIVDKSSVVGKQWGQGDAKLNLDVVNSGYLFKMALGNELLATGTPNVHTFYPTVSGNTPKTATLVFGRDTDVEQYTYAAVNELSIDITEGLGTLHATFLTQFPTDTAALSPVTTSGTVFSFKDMTVQFGSNITAALAAQAVPVTEFSITIANAVETIFRSGSATVSAIRTRGLKVHGKYKLFFENETDKLAYYALNKRALVVTFLGNANESLVLYIPQFRLDEGEIHTGLEDFFMVNASWAAEDVVDSGYRLAGVVLNNSKATVY